MATIIDPLLSSEPKSSAFSFAHSLAKWFLKSLMWLLFLSWAALFFLLPSNFGTQLYDRLEALISPYLGDTGSALLIYNGPLFIIVLLAFPYLALTRKQLEHPRTDGKAAPSLCLWTFPVVVDGPLGVISAAELLGISLFLIFVLWAAYSYTLTSFGLVSTTMNDLPHQRSLLFLQMMVFSFGLVGLSILAFLFLPVGRGSILLRLVDIPFELATKYHSWLGHLTMFLLTVHGLGYLTVWTIRGILLSSIVEWKSDTGANLAGVITYTFGLLMWITTLPPIKNRSFEIFYYTHQLYIPFIFFFALHVNDAVFSVVLAGIFLFMLDRFLRFFQSRRTVDIISATMFPCGTTKFVFKKPRDLQYNALNFIFLRVREVSLLQWHPFSVSSSPLDSKGHLSILVKAVGTWTSRLKDNISNVVSEESYSKMSFPSYPQISASVEGPYGHELPYYLRYRSLILVAGGSGISPFVAIVSDLFHRLKTDTPCYQRNVLIVWAVKKSNEIGLLSEFDGILPSISDQLNIEIQTFITREQERQLEGGEVLEVTKCSVFPASKGGRMSGLVGTGSTIWFGVYLLASSFGFVILFSIMEAYYIVPFSISAWWYRGFLLLACAVAGVFIFGGLVIGLWSYWDMISSTRESQHFTEEQTDDEVVTKEIPLETLTRIGTIRYGCRPDFKEIFGGVSRRWGSVDVGVIVCGPASLESSVAGEIRAHNLKRESSDDPVFHFNSHSFEF